VSQKQSFALFLATGYTNKQPFQRFTHPVYSTHLSLPNNHSIIILKVTRNRKITILIIKPLAHKTIGVTDIIISSKSKIKKIIQKMKNRKETGNTLTLKESKPHSNVSALIIFELIKNLINPITKGTINEITKYNIIIHIKILTNK
jgi:hypothetical protein